MIEMIITHLPPFILFCYCFTGNSIEDGSMIALMDALKKVPCLKTLNLESTVRVSFEETLTYFFLKEPSSRRKWHWKWWGESFK